MLSSYKNSSDWKFNITTIEGHNVFERAANIIERIKKYDPKRAEKYISKINELKKMKAYVNYNFSSRSKLPSVSIPDNYIYTPLITISSSPIPEDNEYKYDKTTWSNLSDDEQALAIVETVILNDNNSLGIQNPEYATYLATYFASSELDSFGFEGYTERLLKTGLLYKYSFATCITTEFDSRYCYPLGKHTIKLGDDNKEFEIDTLKPIEFVDSNSTKFYLSKSEENRFITIQKQKIEINLIAELWINYKTQQLEILCIKNGPYKLRRSGGYTQGDKLIPIFFPKKNFTSMLYFNEKGEILWAISN